MKEKNNIKKYKFEAFDPFTYPLPFLSLIEWFDFEVFSFLVK